jgi:hypothetical protein
MCCRKRKKSPFLLLARLDTVEGPYFLHPYYISVFYYGGGGFRQYFRRPGVWNTVRVL